MHAASICDLDLARKALDAGADPCGTDEDGFSLLMWSAIGESLPLARMLLDRGARVDAANGRGYGALHYACRNADEGMVRLLLEAGSCPEARGDGGKRPLMCCFEPSEQERAAQASERRIGCMRLLLGAGADANGKTDGGRSVLDAALDGWAWAGELQALAKAGARIGRAAGESLEGAALWAWKRAADKDSAACLDVCEGLLPKLGESARTELLRACAACSKAVSARWLLEKGARPDLSWEGTDPLIAGLMAAYAEKRAMEGIGAPRGSAGPRKL